MDDPHDKAADYRRRATACLEVADRMALESDRPLMPEKAQQWWTWPGETKPESCRSAALLPSQFWTLCSNPDRLVSDHVKQSLGAGVRPMPIREFLSGESFDAETLAVLDEAFEGACIDLGVT